MVLYVIIGAVLALLAVIGFIAGLFRGYAKVQSWAGEYVISTLITIGVGVILKRARVSAMVAGVVVIVCAVAFLLACAGVSKAVKSLICKSFKKCDEDFRDYGIAGIFNRILGAFALALKSIAICLVIIVPVLVVLDFVPISELENALASVYNSAFWYALRPYVFDFLIVGVISFAMHRGFKRGIATSLFALLVFGLLVGAGFLSYYLVFNTGAFGSASASLAATVSRWVDNFESLKKISETIAKYIITTGVFLVMFIVIVIIAIFVSKAIKRARFGTGGFALVDGVIGAIVAILIAVAALLFLGYVLNPLYGLDFMKPFDVYFRSSAIARYFYQYNLLINGGVPVIPLNLYPTSLKN